MGTTMPIATFAPVERWLWDGALVVEGEGVGVEEGFVVVFVGCTGMVWLNRSRSLRSSY